MSKSNNVPVTEKLIVPTFQALCELGGSGNNEEILEKIIAILNLPQSVVDASHKGHETMTELAYRAAWARTYLRKYGVIENLGRSTWAIVNGFDASKELDPKNVIQTVSNLIKKNKAPHTEERDFHTPVTQEVQQDSEIEVIEEWRQKVLDILLNMDPYGFERLAQRILRECGFVQVEVTKKSGDGGIDGTGKLKINGIFSFHVAFQCKRYSGSVGSSEIRDFRGSLTTDIEKGIFITTGYFTKAAKEEASNPGKKQIDLIDGEALISIIAEHRIGVREKITYEIDEKFFLTI